MLEKIKEDKVIAIFRGIEIEKLLPKVEMLLNNGLTLMEITLNSPSALESIKTLKKEFGNDIHLGAGTVTTTQEVSQVKELGGEFIISPHMDKEVIQMTKKLDMISIPGVLTPTEIMQAHTYGADMLKIFPAVTQGLNYIKNLKGPFPQLDFIATGGMNENNAQDYIESGYKAIGVGSSLTSNQNEADLKRQLQIYNRLKFL